MHDHAQQRASGPQRDEAHAQQDARGAALLQGAAPLAGLAGHTDEPVQRKLAVGNALDRAEAEADDIARRVMERLREDGAGPGSLAPPAGHEHATVSRSIAAEDGAGDVVGPAGGDLPSGIERDIDRHRGSGQPMPHALRRRMEGAFGADFSGVRLHAGEQARALNDSMQAAAFTAGKDIFFRDGMPRADSAGDQLLLAHELTHTVQQGDSPVLRTLRETDPATVTQAAAPATDQPIRRWGVGKKTTKPDDEKAPDKKSTGKSGKKSTSKTTKKAGKKAGKTATKNATSPLPKAASTGTPAGQAGWTSGKRPGTAGTGGGAIGGHRGTWTSASPGDERKSGATIGGHRTAWQGATPGDERKGSTTLGGHRTKPEPDTSVSDGNSDATSSDTAPTETPRDTSFGRFEGAYSGGQHDEGIETEDVKDTDAEGHDRGGNAFVYSPPFPEHEDTSDSTDSGSGETAYEDDLKLGGDSDAEHTDSEHSEAEHSGTNKTVYEDVQNIGGGTEAKDTVYETDIPQKQDETGPSGGTGPHDSGTEKTEEKSEDAQLAGSAPAPKSQRKARNLAKLKEEYEEERSSQRNDLIAVIKKEADLIAAVYEALERVRTADPDDDDQLEDIIDDCPEGLAAVLAGQDYDEVLRRLTSIHSKKMEQVKRQDLPINEEGELGDISARMVTYDEGPDAQKRTLVTVQGGQLKRSDGRPVDTEGSSTFHSGLGVEIFVVGESGDIHMESHKIGKYHHSSLLAGGNVSMAGEMKVANGKIEWMSNKSGHYQPSTVHFVQFLHQLEKAGVALSFDVKGWGVPEGNTAQEYLDDLDDEQTYEFVKTKTVWKGFVDEFGKDAVKEAIRTQGWKANGSKGTDVTDADGDDVSMETVRKLLKEKFGRGKSRLTQAPSSTPGSTAEKSWV